MGTFVGGLRAADTVTGIKRQDKARQKGQHSAHGRCSQQPSKHRPPSTVNNFFTCSADLYLCLTEGKGFTPNSGAVFQLVPVPIYSPRPLHPPNRPPDFYTFLD